MNKPIFCAFCKKRITKKSEIEWSDHFTEAFCCPDCAMSFYFDQAGSRPIDYKELIELTKTDCKYI